MAATMLLPVPEELVAYILELLKLSLSETLTSSSSLFTPVLLINSAFHRIAKPILYRSLHLKSEDQAAKLADAVCSSVPALGASVRELRVDGPGVGPAFESIVRYINTAAAGNNVVPLDVLDVKIDDEVESDAAGERFQSFVRALQGVRDVRRLVLRKSGYLTKQSTRHAVYEIAASLVLWQSLEHVELKYKVSPVPATSAGMFPSLEHKLKELQLPSKRPGFLDPLALALSCCKTLKVVRAHMPALWNPFLLDVAANASVQRIELLDGSEDSCYPFPVSASSRPRSRGMSDVAPSPSSPFPLSPSSPSYAERKMNEKVRTAAPTTKASSMSDMAEEQIETEFAFEMMPPAPASLFMQNATKHPRLHALVLAGRRHMFLQDMRRRGLRRTSRRPPPLPHVPSSPVSSRSRAHSALPATPTSLVTRGLQNTTSN